MVRIKCIDEEFFLLTEDEEETIVAERVKMEPDASHEFDEEVKSNFCATIEEMSLFIKKLYELHRLDDFERDRTPVDPR